MNVPETATFHTKAVSNANPPENKDLAKDRTRIEIERRKWCDKIPETMQKTYRKAMAGRSLRAAINAKCQDCTNWQREEVRHCSVLCCPLYEYRPYRMAENSYTAPLEASTEKKTVLHGHRGDLG